ncbi:MAG: hypothetical protein SFW07_02535 [Gammaproteobacteria bacterium]|nr:hypothetical protein [Gammaproteobacteria bacterium]
MEEEKETKTGKKLNIQHKILVLRLILLRGIKDNNVPLNLLLKTLIPLGRTKPLGKAVDPFVWRRLAQQHGLDTQGVWDNQIRSHVLSTFFFQAQHKQQKYIEQYNSTTCCRHTDPHSTTGRLDKEQAKCIVGSTVSIAATFGGLAEAASCCNPVSLAPLSCLTPAAAHLVLWGTCLGIPGLACLIGVLVCRDPSPNDTIEGKEFIDRIELLENSVGERPKITMSETPTEDTPLIPKRNDFENDNNTITNRR